MLAIELEAQESLLQPAVQRMRVASERRRHGEGDGDRHRENDEPVLGEPAAAYGDASDDERELAVARQMHRGEERCAGAQPEAQEHEEEQRRLHGQQQREQQAEQHIVQTGNAGHADLQEERDEEQLLESPERVRELDRTRVARDERPEQQRAQLGAQSQLLEAVAADEGEEQSEQQQQLLVSAALEEAEDERP